MAFKMYYIFLWLFFICFTVVKGSCLEYGHSCWGAHGKRSGNHKIFRAKDKAPLEYDFQDLNVLSDKNLYDGTAELLNGASDSLPVSQGLGQEVGDNDVVSGPDKNSMNFKKFLYKKVNRTSKQQQQQRIMENPEYHISIPAMNERWRRLPLYNLRRVQITRPESNWLNELDQEQQINEADYI